MKPPPLEYLRATNTADALHRLAEAGPEARLLAGGQSLIPMLNLRIARPSHLVDIGRIDELNRLGVLDGELVAGALVRHHVLEHHPVVAGWAPVLAAAAARIGHPAIRHRGTLAGSVAHADPSGELLAVAMLLDATVVVESATTGPRRVPAREFVAGPYETVLAPDEMVTWLRFPRPRAGSAGFAEIARRPGDFALAGAAVALPDPGDDRPAVAVTFGAGRGYRLTSAPAGTATPTRAPAGIDELARLLYPEQDGQDDRLRRTAIVRALRAARPAGALVDIGGTGGTGHG